MGRRAGADLIFPTRCARSTHCSRARTGRKPFPDAPSDHAAPDCKQHRATVWWARLHHRSVPTDPRKHCRPCHQWKQRASPGRVAPRSVVLPAMNGIFRPAPSCHHRPHSVNSRMRGARSRLAGAASARSGQLDGAGRRGNPRRLAARGGRRAIASSGGRHRARFRAAARHPTVCCKNDKSQRG